MRTLYPFQVEDVEKAKHQDTLILSECGIGKTVEAIEVVKVRRLDGAKGPVLVLCNNSAKAQWAEFLEEWDPDIPVVVTGRSGRWPTGEVAIEHWFHPRHDVWVIAHHESLSLPKVGTKAWHRRKYRAPTEWRKYAWEAIIIDECHKYSRKSQRFMWLRALPVIYRLGLTGTPIDKSPADMWPMLKWVRPNDFSGYWAFDEEWVEREVGWHGHSRIIGMKRGRSQDFARMIEPYTIMRGKRDPDVRPDLPPKIEETLPLRMDPKSKQYRAYVDIGKATDLEVKLRDVPGDWHLLVPNMLAKIVRLQQVLSDPRMLGIKAGSVKLEWVKDYCSDNPTESVVIFTKFRMVAEWLTEELNAAIAIGGRVEGLAEFQKGNRAVLVGTIAKMGESLNLQAATTAIFMDHEWSTRKMQQAYDRVDRIDITESKHIIHLKVLNSVDNLVLKALKDKWSDQELVWNYLKEVPDGGLREKGGEG